MDVGTLLRDTRVARGLGQADLARRAGTTQTYVSRVERGGVSPSLTTLRRLFNAMGQELELGVRPMSVGNVSIDDLRRDFRARTPEERVQDAMELSDFLVGVSEQAARGATSG